MSSSPLGSYREEIQQLRNSLKEALREKYEAAQCGLKLLEEKEGLQAKLDESEELLEQLRRELQLTQEVTNDCMSHFPRNVMNKMSSIER